MIKPIKIYLFGSENNGWALDADLATTRQSLLQLPDLVELTSLKKADIVYSVWEYPLLQLDARRLVDKKIICQICNNFWRIHEHPSMTRAAKTVSLWVPMNSECIQDVGSVGYDHFYIPYAVDTLFFTPSPVDVSYDKEQRSLYEIPEDAFIISNFMRDSNGHNLVTPKEQKGPELFLEIGKEIISRNIPVHFLLAGPRRHWIRAQMDRFSIPYTFIGQEVDIDDNSVNILGPDRINKLYHLSDVHLVSSRWEGGPRAVLECAATRTVMISTPVGVALDILNRENLYSTVKQGADIIEQHYHHRHLDKLLAQQYQRVIENHTPQANVKRFAALVERIDDIPTFQGFTSAASMKKSKIKLRSRVGNKLSRFFGTSKIDNQLCISLWHEFHKPPYGGGNQFMMALQSSLKRLGVKVETNKINSNVDIHICNSAWFDKTLFEKKTAEFPIRMIHRIDGPTTLYRGKGTAEDDQIFTLNREFAAATVFQSAYSFKKSYELGYHAVSPVIIPNSVNDDIFHPTGRIIFSRGRKIKLISSAWSDNPRKGGPFLKWLDEHLDWSRFEYTFVGRVKEQFCHIQHVPPQNSEALADLLRNHHIFVSVSHNEPCSNALIEALCSGMPALYRDDGGNAELVSYGGLPFSGENDVLKQLDDLVEGYEHFQRLIRITPMDIIAQRYADLAQTIIEWDHE